MSLIAHRYLFREVLQVFAAVLAVLLLIYVSNRFVRYLAQAASGYISNSLILELMLLKLAENLAILLPLAFYLAVLLAVGRLYRDSEITAMAASGIGLKRLAGSLVWLSGGFAVVAAALSLVLSPRAAEVQQELFERAKGEAQLAGLHAGRFKEFGEGERVVYVERVAADGRTMERVFVQVRRPGGQDLLVADRAFASVQGREADRFVVLEDGYRYSGSPGQLDFVITRFERHAVRLEPAARSGKRRLEATPTLDLVRAGGARNVAELQWRLSLPLSVVLLTILAVPLARTSPREGRYAKLVTAFVVYFLYNNGIGIAQKLVERGELHPAVGVWPVHALAAAVGLGLLLGQTRLVPRRGWIARLRRESSAS